MLIKLTQSQNNYSNLHFYCSTLVFNIYFLEFAKLLGGPGPPRPLPTLRHWQDKASTPLPSQVKWLSKKKIVGNSTVNWRNAYYLPFLCTRETKLRVFQFKFLHRRIATIDFLCKIGIKQADSCSFCGEATETLVHLFWNCKHTKAFWKKYSNGCPKKL